MSWAMRVDPVSSRGLLILKVGEGAGEKVRVVQSEADSTTIPGVEGGGAGGPGMQAAGKGEETDPPEGTHPANISVLAQA